jgi:hypothetical protein
VFSQEVPLDEQSLTYVYKKLDSRFKNSAKLKFIQHFIEIKLSCWFLLTVTNIEFLFRKEGVGRLKLKHSGGEAELEGVKYALQKNYLTAGLVAFI